MAHTTTLRAHGAACASDARFSRPCSSRASRYFISPPCPAAIQRGKYSNSGASPTGATPASSNPASLAAFVTAAVISTDRSMTDESSKLEPRFTFLFAKLLPYHDQRIRFSSQSHATHAARSPNFFVKETTCYASTHPRTNPQHHSHHSDFCDQRKHRAGRLGCRASRGCAPEASDQRLRTHLGDRCSTHHRPQGHATAHRELVARAARRLRPGQRPGLSRSHHGRAAHWQSIRRQRPEGGHVLDRHRQPRTAGDARRSQH